MGSLFRSDEQVGSPLGRKVSLDTGVRKEANHPDRVSQQPDFPHLQVLIGAWHEMFLQKHLGWLNWVQQQPANPRGGAVPASPGSLSRMHLLSSSPVPRGSESAFNLGLK